MRDRLEFEARVCLGDDDVELHVIATGDDATPLSAVDVYGIERIADVCSDRGAYSGLVEMCKAQLTEAIDGVRDDEIDRKREMARGN